MITKQEIENIALLSKLCVADEELEPLRAQLERMIEFANTVSNADVSCVAPDIAEVNSTPYRKDAVMPSLSLDDVLANAPESSDGHFLVRKRA